MKLKYKNGFFYTRCSFEERSLPKKAGFSWHQKYKVWFTKDPYLAMKLEKYAEPCAAPVIAQVKNTLAQSYATESNLIVPCPPDKTLRPYQKAAVEWCATRTNAIIGDEMGLGKSIISVTLANYLRARKVIVICPASLKLNWQKEFLAWQTEDWTIHVVKSTLEKIPECDVLIVNYDVLAKTKIYDQLKLRKFDLMVLDEAHYLKNPKALRTRTVLQKNRLRTIASRVLVLSGTPITNKPIEFYPLLSSLAPETIRPHDNYYAYARYFCNAYQGNYGLEVNGASNVEELNMRLRSTVMMRRLKKDVLKDLPEKMYQVITFEEGKITGKLLKQEHELRERLHFDQNGGMKFRGIELGEISALRKEMALAKLPDSITHIQDVLDGGQQKIVVFAHHREVVLRLEEALRPYGTVKITGETPMAERQKAVDAFQTNPEKRVFIGNITAAGVGLTLTAANHVVFVEISWVPGENEQAADRAHRLGQKNSVLVQFLVVRDSLDEYILKRALDKKRVLDRILA